MSAPIDTGMPVIPAWLQTPRGLIFDGVRGAARLVAVAVATAVLQQEVPSLQLIEQAELERILADLRALADRLDPR